MNTLPLDLKPVNYKTLNARQQETYNFQKVSAVLADFGFMTIRLSDDWQGADFLAVHINGKDFLKVQLKGRLTLDQKYSDKDIWICFHYDKVWYLYPHDEALVWALKDRPLGRNPDVWDKGRGVWTYPIPPQYFLTWLQSYALINPVIAADSQTTSEP